MSVEECNKANKKTCSSFNAPIFYFPCKKKNGGIMHDPAEHITNVMIHLSNCIRDKMMGYNWQLRVMNIDLEVKVKITKVNTAKRLGACVEESKEIDKRIKQIRKRKKDCNTRVTRETIDELANKFRLEAKQLEKCEEVARDVLRQQTSMTNIGEYKIILEGLKDFQGILKSKNKLNGKRPQSSLECAF